MSDVAREVEEIYQRWCNEWSDVNERSIMKLADDLRLLAARHGDDSPNGPISREIFASLTAIKKGGVL